VVEKEDSRKAVQIADQHTRFISNYTSNAAPTCTSSCSLLALALLLTRYGSPRSSWSALLPLPPLLLLLLPGRATPVFSAMKPSTLSALSMPVTQM
jgi:hypothetical protein